MSVNIENSGDAYLRIIVVSNFATGTNMLTQAFTSHTLILFCRNWD